LHTRNQIDHISVLSRWRKLLLNAREYRWADIDSDHHLVIGEVKVRIARVKQNGGLASKKINYQKLLNAETKDAFLIELKNRLSVLKVEEEKSNNTLWEETKEVFTGTSKEVLGYMTKEKLISDYSWQLIEGRKILKQQIIQESSGEMKEILDVQYRDMRQKITKSVRRAKENGQRILRVKLKKQKRRTILVLLIKLRGYYLVNFPPSLGLLKI
jgi:hypothetical protein